MKLWLGICLVGLIMACNDKANEPEPTIQYGKGGRIELGADVEIDFEIDGDELRNLDLYQRDLDGDGRVDEFTYEIDIEQYKAKKMTLFLKREGDSNTTRIETPVQIKKTATGYAMSIIVENIQPQGQGLNFASGEWYITGYWGGGVQPTPTTEHATYQIADIAPISPQKIGDKASMNIPLGFPWTKITGEQKGAVYVMQNFELKIQPLGVLLCIIPENRTVYTLDLVKLDKALEGFAIGGKFEVGQSSAEDMKAGRFPHFSSTVGENLNNDAANVLPKVISLPSGQKSTTPIYIWAIPTAETKDDYALSFSLMSSERSTIDADIPAEDRFQTNGIGKFTDRYTIDLTFSKAPKHGQYFIRDVKLRTSPMITEYFVNRVRNGAPTEYNNGSSSLPAFNHPYFYGYVELYNPNLDDIALDNYALARISNIRWATYQGTIYYYDSRGYYTGTYSEKYTYGGNYPYWHPMARDKFERWKDGSQGTADRNADSNTESHKALLLSLQLKDQVKSNFQPNSLGFNSSLETASHSIEHNLLVDAANDNRTERVRFFKGQIPNGERPYLKGGKTMLLLGNAFLENSSTGLTPASPGDSRVTPLPQSIWDRVMNDDACQIIVAVDNYEKRTAYSIDKEAGVMNIGWHDALLLVQKHGKDSSKRRVVDATSAHPFARVNNWTDFAAKVTLASETDTGKAHFRVRTAAQHLPEFLNFQAAQWHAALHTNRNSIPAHVSPGRRYVNK